MAIQYPITLDELQNISGVGQERHNVMEKNSLISLRNMLRRRK
jgi:hypothetical protein